jgi:hypothetical protein
LMDCTNRFKRSFLLSSFLWNRNTVRKDKTINLPASSALILGPL